ncbi:MAG: hypothetical protein LBQ33_02465 [Oscillospiraceae bacterium]|jgi:hypothetical protein|nr:hypothetical protein [Oscillospiraceae bacterium]
MSSRFDLLRAKHPVFHYHGYRLKQGDGCLVVTFDFSIEGLCEFHPETRIFTENLVLRNAWDTPQAEDLVFSLGLVELISYWKCVCPPEIRIHCGSLNDEEADWWRRLWFCGLGEFFYRNQIKTTFSDFAQVTCDAAPGMVACDFASFQSGGFSLVPVGGGKDSCVTLQLMKEQNRPLMGFTVNDQRARSECFAAAGFLAENMLRTQRRIDPALLARNGEGYWNGHTPFSAVVAFLGLFCAYLTGAEELVLSNEASAEEASIPGTQVNHQYSKSYAFEQDMNAYIRRRFCLPIHYFSLLRPFHELQIARRFAALPQFHAAFKSCNAGSKQNVWCGHCAKCLFVYLMLSPFLPMERLTEIFGGSLLERPDLAGDLRDILGLTSAKPFECVGTVAEARAALALLTVRSRTEGRPPPLLARTFADCASSAAEAQALLGAFGEAGNIPAAYLQSIERMREHVSAAIGSFAG